LPLGRRGQEGRRDLLALFRGRFSPLILYALALSECICVGAKSKRGGTADGSYSSTDLRH
jgi:hypothetical protein